MTGDEIKILSINLEEESQGSWTREGQRWAQKSQICISKGTYKTCASIYKAQEPNLKSGNDLTFGF